MSMVSSPGGTPEAGEVMGDTQRRAKLCCTLGAGWITWTWFAVSTVKHLAQSWHGHHIPLSPCPAAPAAPLLQLLPLPPLSKDAEGSLRWWLLLRLCQKCCECQVLCGGHRQPLLPAASHLIRCIIGSEPGNETIWAQFPCWRVPRPWLVAKHGGGHPGGTGGMRYGGTRRAHGAMCPLLPARCSPVRHLPWPPTSQLPWDAPAPQGAAVSCCTTGPHLGISITLGAEITWSHPCHSPGGCPQSPVP